MTANAPDARLHRLHFDGPLWNAVMTDDQRRDVLRWLVAHRCAKTCVAVWVHDDGTASPEKIVFHPADPAAPDAAPVPVVVDDALVTRPVPVGPDPAFPALPWDALAAGMDGWAREHLDTGAVPEGPWRAVALGTDRAASDRFAGTGVPPWGAWAYPDGPDGPGFDRRARRLMRDGG